MLCVEGMVGHGLLLNMSGQRVLVEETVPISKGVLWALNGLDQVMVGDVDVDLGVGWTCEEGGVLCEHLGGGAYLMLDTRRGACAYFLCCGYVKDVVHGKLVHVT